MRMWMVDPAIMCRKHLLGEHVETHMFYGSMNKGINLDGYIANNLLEADSLATRHEALAKEMVRRGYRHHSPMLPENVQTILEYYPKRVLASTVDVAASLEDLLARCPDCRRFHKSVTSGELLV